MFVEQLIKKKEECIILSFLEEGGCFSPLGWLLPPYALPLFSFFLYAKKP
jgi:hypothetical protein